MVQVVVRICFFEVLLHTDSGPCGCISKRLLIMVVWDDCARGRSALLPFAALQPQKKNCQKPLMELSEVDDGTRVRYLRCSADPNSN